MLLQLESQGLILHFLTKETITAIFNLWIQAVKKLCLLQEGNWFMCQSCVRVSWNKLKIKGHIVFLHSLNKPFTMSKSNKYSLPFSPIQLSIVIFQNIFVSWID